MTAKKRLARRQPVTVTEVRRIHRLWLNLTEAFDSAMESLEGTPGQAEVAFDGSGRMPEVLQSVNAWVSGLQKAARDKEIAGAAHFDASLQQQVESNAFKRAEQGIRSGTRKTLGEQKSLIPETDTRNQSKLPDQSSTEQHQAAKAKAGKTPQNAEKTRK